MSYPEDGNKPPMWAPVPYAWVFVLVLSVGVVYLTIAELPPGHGWVWVADLVAFAAGSAVGGRVRT